MFDSLVENYATVVYPVAFFGVIGVIGLCEVLFPRRRHAVSFLLRWPNSFGMTFINTALFGFLFPLLAVPFAVAVTELDVGLFNNIDIPFWLAAVISLFVLDFSKWFQHWLLHRVPFLWLVHRTHHVDQEYDFTTGLRFHPFDALFTMSTHLVTIALLGAPIEAVVISELLAVTNASFAHANMKIPLGVDRVLRLAIVTPDLHRVHHSTQMDETNSNFGSVLPWWDRLFGTYKDQPDAGHEGMTIGLNEFSDRKHLQIHWALINPFLSAKTPVKQQKATKAKQKKRRTKSSKRRKAA